MKQTLMQKYNLIFIGILLVLTLFLISSAFALTINTTSFNVDSIHLGTSGTGNISTTNYQARDTITYQQASTSNLQTTSYTANSGWFFIESTSVGEVNITDIFFSNESVFNFSNVFNSANITYDMNLTYIGVNCTAATGNVVNVTFSLFNTEDNITYINTTGYTYRLNESGNFTDLYILNASFQVRDSGNWTLNVSCFASGGGLTDKDANIWEIAWGAIQINLIQPLVDTSVQIYEFFTFSANVTCSGGECGIVNVTLDPEEVNCVEEEVCEDLVVGTECVNETVQSCDKECSIVESEVCEDIITDNCIRYETINDSETDNCLESEIIKNCTSEIKEICINVNCTEQIIENCTDIVEQNCTTDIICDISSNETSEDYIEIPSNETSSEEGEDSSREEELDPTEEQALPPELNETEIQEQNETTKEQEMPGKEFEKGEILETEQGKDLGEKTQDELEYETRFLEMEQTDEEFRIVFYHDYNNTLPIRIEGDVNYDLNKNESDYLENVTLVVELIDGILPQFELHIGEESEVFIFGKVIPKVELRKGNYTLIDRNDLKLDVIVKFDSGESIILRGLENEPNINVTLGINSQEDVSTSIIAVPFINIENATIILEKSKGVNAIISCDDKDFDYETLECSNWKYTNIDFIEINETIKFDVDHFTAYAGGNLTASETAFLTIWDENDVGMPNASTNTTSIKIANETIKFFANYELARNGTKLSNGNCSIDFSDSNATNMVYNSTYTYFVYERNFTSNGAYPYTVNCTSSSYTNLSASDSIVIGQFSNATKGAVSTITGAVPFYTINDNPQQTNNLRGGESQTITWSVNATGILNKIYDFFVETIGTYISGTNSSHINIQITANDTTIPTFVSKTIIPAAVINSSSTIINADVSDNIQVDSVWANITLPDNSSEFISSGNLPYTFINTNLIGIYTVAFYANDSSGNNATTTKTFQVALPANLTMNVSIEVDITLNVSTNVNFIAYVSGTKDVIEERLNLTGSESVQLPNVPVDLFFDSSFDNSNMLTTLFEFNISDNTNNSIAFGNPTLSEFLVTYGIETDFNFTNAQSEFFYSGSNFSNEDNLKLFRCNSFNISSGACTSGFNDVTNEAVTIQDKPNDKFIYNTTSFSGFGIREVTPITTDDSVSTVSSIGASYCIYDVNYDWKCGEWSECINDTQIRTCKEVNNCKGTFGRPEVTRSCVPVAPTQLFDISFSLDDSLIQSSDELSAVVTFESFGTVPTPVDLTFIILDESGNEIYREKSEITVTTEEVLRKSFEGLNLPEGKYTLILNTLYNVDVFDEFRQEFEIGMEEKREGISVWSLVAVIITGILVIIGVIYFIIKLRRKKK